MASKLEKNTALSEKVVVTCACEEELICQCMHRNNINPTVLQERLQPMSDGKRHFIVGYFLCYSYKLILISPGIFHRALFEKWLTLVAEKSPESAKFTYSNLEAFNVHPPSYVILILKKMPFFIILLYPLPDKSPHLAAENLWILWK